MLDQVEVRNFQSLRSVNIPLRRFTVITGPNGAGKSAAVRAMLLLARNARGTSYITEAEKSCSVTAGNGDWIARVTRSNSPRGKNEYVTAVRDGETWTRTRDTKLAGQVPDRVTGLLGLTDLNFAGQFDPPYLLAEPGTAIARHLGALTNVSLVFGAAAEANRVRKQLARDLEATRDRRDALQEEVQQFADLKERREAAEAAGDALGRLEGLSLRRERLEAAAGRLELLELRLAGAREQAARQAPPSLEKLEALAARRARLRALAGALASAERDAARFGSEAREARQRGADTEALVHELLADIGQCPVCGSVIRPD